jgi:hypothetical protein
VEDSASNIQNPDSDKKKMNIMQNIYGNKITIFIIKNCFDFRKESLQNLSFEDALICFKLDYLKNNGRDFTPKNRRDLNIRS